MVIKRHENESIFLHYMVSDLFVMSPFSGVENTSFPSDVLSPFLSPKMLIFAYTESK